MGKIPEELIEQIAAANDIVDVVGSYIPLKRAGGNWRALCPFHQEKTPSFNVNPSRQSFHCFGCGKGGGVFRFVMDYENIDFVSAVKKLAEKAGIQIEETEFNAEEDQRYRLRKRLLAIHQQGAEWFHQNLLKSQGAAGARDYLKGRGLNSAVAKAWKIGYAPDAWDAFGNWARGEGFTPEEIAASGLVSQKEGEGGSGGGRFYDRFRDRVMFPICNEQAEVIGFSGRMLQADAKGAKYVNSPETMLFTKSKVLFGLHKSKRALLDKGSAIVCEGQIDLISAFEAGVQNVVAPQGTAFTAQQTHILKRYVEEVVLCFDSDTAGQNATDKSLVSLLGDNLAVRVAALPPGEDPDSLIRNKGAEAFVELIAGAKDFFDFQIDRAAASPEFQNPRARMQFARKMGTWAGLITDQILRETVIHKVATRLEISTQEFVKLLKQPAADTREPREGRESRDGRGGYDEREGSSVAEQEGREVTLPEPVISNLIYIALNNAEARAWLLAQDWQAVLAEEANAELLAQALGRDLDVADGAGVNSWLSGLPRVEESAYRRIMEKGIMPISLPSRNDAVVARPETASGVLWHPLRTAQDAWLYLKRGRINRRIEAIQARLRSPDLPFEIIIKLQKETLDLKAQLTDIARPFSSNPEKS